MQELNPYAPPATAAPTTASVMPDGQAGIWRQGKTLVMERQATLPDICVKSNQPTEGYRLKRNLSWHHPGWALLVIINIPIYAVVALMVSKRSVVHIGLSDAWRRRRLRRIWLAWLCVLLAVVGGVAGVWIAENGEESIGVPMLLGSVVVFFGGLLYGMISARLIRAKRIDKKLVWFNGAHPDFLNRFPEFGAEDPAPQPEFPK